MQDAKSSPMLRTSHDLWRSGDCRRPLTVMLLVAALIVIAPPAARAEKPARALKAKVEKKLQALGSRRLLRQRPQGLHSKRRQIFRDKFKTAQQQRHRRRAEKRGRELNHAFKRMVEKDPLIKKLLGAVGPGRAVMIRRLPDLWGSVNSIGQAVMVTGSGEIGVSSKRLGHANAWHPPVPMSLSTIREHGITVEGLRRSLRALDHKSTTLYEIR